MLVWASTLIRPDALTRATPHGPWNCRGLDIWAVFCAARDGDVGDLDRLLAEDRNLHRAEYWYTQPLHFAVREGQLEAVRRLLQAGADPDWRGLSGDSLRTAALDRAHVEVTELLDSWERCPGGRSTPLAEGSIHRAAAADDPELVRALLEEDGRRLHEADQRQLTPLHRAVAASARRVVDVLLELGADPNWPEGPGAPRGAALYTASAAGDRGLVELLLNHGADPNATIDSAGSPTFAAATPEIRELLIAHGGKLDPYDWVFLGEEDEALRAVEADPESAQVGCGGVLAAACKLGKPGLVERLLALGVRVASSLTGCRSYLWSDVEALKLLLASGMDANLPDWMHATPLHSLCERDGRGRPRPHRLECFELLLAAGADLSARDEDYRSTPLGWAARNGLEEMVDLLLARGASLHEGEGPRWATPAAWARRRGHDALSERLASAGC